jgi:hypothetical protein
MEMLYGLKGLLMAMGLKFHTATGEAYQGLFLLLLGPVYIMGKVFLPSRFCGNAENTRSTGAVAERIKYIHLSSSLWS